MKSFSFIYFALLILLIGCSKKKETTELKSNLIKNLEVNEDDYEDLFDIDNFISKIDFVFLKTQKNNLISSIEDIRLFDKHVFIHDKSFSRILIFDSEGELISKIQMQGPGPKEYSDISFFDINEKEKTVEILDIQSGKIFKYDFNGNFKTTLRATIICRDFAISRDGDYLFYCPDEQNQHVDGTILEPGLIHLSKDGKKIKNILKLGNKSYYPMLSAGKSLVGVNDKFNLFSNYSDTIYTIKNDKVIEKLAISYNNKLDERALFNPNFNIADANFPFLKLRPFMTSNYLSYTFLHRGNPKVLFHDRLKKKSSIFKVLINNVNHTPFVLNGKMDRSGRNYICIIDEMLIELFRSTLLREDVSEQHKVRIKEIIKEFDENQNPILAFGKLI